MIRPSLIRTSNPAFIGTTWPIPCLGIQDIEGRRYKNEFSALVRDLSSVMLCNCVAKGFHLMSIKHIAVKDVLFQEWKRARQDSAEREQVGLISLSKYAILPF